ncbi:hypothetical protein MUP77_04675, partial [Candidatus Bathyarchaeota archaeon]|nr:hypothetical protein [Candidatus Bathyarchaeota archaeon]
AFQFVDEVVLLTMYLPAKTGRGSRIIKKQIRKNIDDFSSFLYNASFSFLGKDLFNNPTQ